MCTKTEVGGAAKSVSASCKQACASAFDASVADALRREIKLLWDCVLKLKSVLASVQQEVDVWHMRALRAAHSQNLNEVYTILCQPSVPNLTGLCEKILEDNFGTAHVRCKCATLNHVGSSLLSQDVCSHWTPAFQRPSSSSVSPPGSGTSKQVMPSGDDRPLSARTTMDVPPHDVCQEHKKKELGQPRTETWTMVLGQSRTSTMESGRHRVLGALLEDNCPRIRIRQRSKSMPARAPDLAGADETDGLADDATSSYSALAYYEEHGDEKQLRRSCSAEQIRSKDPEKEEQERHRMWALRRSNQLAVDHSYYLVQRSFETGQRNEPGWGSEGKSVRESFIRVDFDD